MARLGSVRWQHFLAFHTDNIQWPAKFPDCLLGEVTPKMLLHKILLYQHASSMLYFFQTI